jgi:hypothetical protein
VHESRAVCKYLTVKYNVQGIELIPDQKGVQKYALFKQVSFENEEKEFTRHGFMRKDMRIQSNISTGMFHRN